VQGMAGTAAVAQQSSGWKGLCTPTAVLQLCLGVMLPPHGRAADASFTGGSGLTRWPQRRLRVHEPGRCWRSPTTQPWLVMLLPVLGAAVTAACGSCMPRGAHMVYEAALPAGRLAARHDSA
jgi:hypothetical protein